MQECMWYTIICPDCGNKFTYFTDHDEYGVNALYSIIEKHDNEYRHRDPALETKPEYEVKNWIRSSMVKTLEKDSTAYES